MQKHRWKFALIFITVLLSGCYWIHRTYYEVDLTERVTWVSCGNNLSMLVDRHSLRMILPPQEIELWGGYPFVIGMGRDEKVFAYNIETQRVEVDTPDAENAYARYACRQTGTNTFASNLATIYDLQEGAQWSNPTKRAELVNALKKP